MEKMSGKRLETIRNHFEQEAAEFDANFYRIAPHYKDMIRSAAELLPFAKADKVKILDLGCGTGNLTGEIRMLQLPVWILRKICCGWQKQNLRRIII